MCYGFLDNDKMKDFGKELILKFEVKICPKFFYIFNFEALSNNINTFG